jgi:hypothetical protein
LDEVLDVGMLQEGATMSDDPTHSRGQLLHQSRIGVGISTLRGQHPGRKTRFGGVRFGHVP